MTILVEQNVEDMVQREYKDEDYMNEKNRK